MLAEIVDQVGMDRVVPHAVDGSCPAPTNADAAVREVPQFIVLKRDIPYETGNHAAATPILIGNVIHQIIADQHVLSELPLIGRIVGQMCLHWRVRKLPDHQPASGNIPEQTTLYPIVVATVQIIQTGRTGVQKAAMLKGGMVHVPKHHCRRLATHPGLILQCCFVGCAGHLQLVGVQNKHPSLKRHITHPRRTHPSAVRKRDALESQIVHWSLRRSFHLHQRFKCRNQDFSVYHVLAVFGNVIQFAQCSVVVPFARHIQKLNGTPQHKS